MKKVIVLLFLIALVNPGLLRAQINNVTVETYYVSDGNDATDLDGAGGTVGLNLQPGSKTYRVYIDLVPGSRLIEIYGDAMHNLKIASTENFFNNRDRGKRFGKDILYTKLKKNTVAIDTWLTLGKATNFHHGVLKSKDTNGTILHPGNDGGSDGITGGLLVNNDAAAGIPLSVEDGLIHDSLVMDTVTPTLWIENGFTDSLGVDQTIFGEQVAGSEFSSNNAFLRLNSGVISPVSGDNNVLVAQLTTHGEISFELNVIVKNANGQEIHYVASGNDTTYVNQSQQTIVERLSPYLKYPPACGCTDPHYLEFSSAYACSDPGACHTPIVFGCMDPLACNFKPDANFNIPDLCCYPGRCNDRDIAVVCPVLVSKQIHLYPNPAHDEVTLSIYSALEDNGTRYVVYDSFGRVMCEKNISVPQGPSTVSLDVSRLSKGVYMFRLFSGESSESRMFLKD